MRSEGESLCATAAERHQSNDLPAAIELYRRYLLLSPGDASACNNLSVALAQSGRTEEAVGMLRRALELKPDFPEAHNNLGNAYQELGNLDAAIDEHRKAIALAPQYADAQENLAKALLHAGRPTEALEAHLLLLQLRPSDPQVINNLGTVLGWLGRGDEALQHFEWAARIDPLFADAHYNIGAEYLRRGAIDRAIEVMDTAIRLHPGFALAHLNRGNALREQGRGEEALDAYRQAMRADPNTPNYRSNLLYALWFCSSQTPAAIVQEHRRWAGSFRTGPVTRHPPRDRGKRQLRVGFVSSNLGYHVVGMMIEPLLEGLDREKFEIACYSDHRQADPVNLRLRSHARIWRDTAEWEPRQLASAIVEDRVDVLIDLTLHMANNRMSVFATRPAPVQATYLGYAGTTGLEEMDYRLTDAYLDPPGEPDALGVEKRAYLPVYWNYVPPLDVPDVNELPCLSRGPVTFINLNHPGKMSADAVAVWSRILMAMPQSRIMLYAAGGAEGNSGPHRAFAPHGIGPDRIEVLSHSARAQFLLHCQRADIALDPFPCNGGITTLDTLWMGVPVISMPGPTPLGRAGVCILAHLGLHALIASSSEEYIDLAVSLARDRPKLVELRRMLRDRVASSPLMDRKLFVRGFEEALWRMWRDE